MGEVIAFLKGKGISKDDIIGDGVNKCIRYGELYTEYGEVVQKVVSLTNVPAERSLESKFGDVMIPSSGETAWDIAVASCILEDGVLLGGDMNVCDQVMKLTEFFWLTIFQTDQREILHVWHKVILLSISTPLISGV